MLTAHFRGELTPVSTLSFFSDNQKRSEQKLEDDGTTVAPPQRLRSHAAASQPLPLLGSTRQRLENRTEVENADDETESSENEDDEQGSENDENDDDDSNGSNHSNHSSENSDSNADDDDEGNQGAKKASGYVFPFSFALLRAFYYIFRRRRPPILSGVVFIIISTPTPPLEVVFFIST